MAVLDTFYLMFKSDTSDLKKGVGEVQKIISGLSSVLSAAIPAAFGIAGIKKAIDYGVELSRTSQKLGANAADIQAWGNAVEIAGGNAKQFESTLSSMSAKFNTTSDTILKVLPRYADLLSKLSPSRAQQVGRNLGLDESTILLLQRGRRELDGFLRRQKELGTLTKEDTETFKKYDQSVTKASQSFGRLNQVLALTSIPFLTTAMNALDRAFIYFIDHQDLIIGGIIALTAATTVLGFTFGALSLPVIGVTSLVLALSAVFAIAYEDIKAFIEGSESLIGDIVNSFPNAAAAVKSFFNIMKDAIMTVMHPLELLEKLFDRIMSKIQGSSGAKLLTDLTSGDLSKAKQTLIDVRAQSRDSLNKVPFLASGNTNSSSVTTGAITINTQATDAQGIASNLKDRLDQQYSQVANYHSDGVLA